MPKKPKAMIRDGRTLTVLPSGDRRRMSDGRNAMRKMSTAQREEFLDWIADEFADEFSDAIERQKTNGS